MSEQKRQKTAVVTGSASGIGRGLTLEFACRGYKVFAADISPLDEVVAKYPDNIVPVKMDVSKLESIKEGYEFVKAELTKIDPVPKLDILYNNAGVACSFPALDVPIEDLQRCININLIAPMLVTQVFQDPVISAKGTLCYTGSTSAISTLPWTGVYCATKGGLQSYCGTLRYEMEPFGVKVIHVYTGGINTNLAHIKPIRKESIYLTTEEGKEYFKDRDSILENGALMEPEDYAKSVVTQIENAGWNTFNIYEGYLSWVSPFSATFLPRWLMSNFLTKKIGLVQLFESYRKKYKDSP